MFVAVVGVSWICACVVHHDIDAAEFGRNLIERGLNSRIVANIDSQWQRSITPALAISAAAVCIVPSSFGCGSTVFAAMAMLAPSAAAFSRSRGRFRVSHR